MTCLKLTLVLLVIAVFYVKLSKANQIACPYYPNYPDKSVVYQTWCQYRCYDNSINSNGACYNNYNNFWNTGRLVGAIVGGIISLLVAIGVALLIIFCCGCGCIPCFGCIPCCGCCGYDYEI